MKAAEFRTVFSQSPIAPGIKLLLSGDYKILVFHTGHTQGAQDFTGSEHWDPFKFPLSGALELTMDQSKCAQNTAYCEMVVLTDNVLLNAAIFNSLPTPFNLVMFSSTSDL